MELPTESAVLSRLRLMSGRARRGLSWSVERGTPWTLTECDTPPGHALLEAGLTGAL